MSGHVFVGGGVCVCILTAYACKLNNKIKKEEEKTSFRPR